MTGHDQNQLVQMLGSGMSARNSMLKLCVELSIGYKEVVLKVEFQHTLPFMLPLPKCPKSVVPGSESNPTLALKSPRM